KDAPGRRSYRRRFFRAALWWVGLPAVAYVTVCVGMMWQEESFIFFPSRFPEGDWRPSLPVEDAWFEAADGVRLHGWFLAHPQPRRVVLYCHGNAGNITHRADILEDIHRFLDASVLVWDYRGYGRSEGRPTERGVLLDAEAARNWLAKRTGWATDRLVLWGHSLGGAVAVHLAAAGGAEALVLESTFTCLPDVAAHHYPWLPVRLLMRNRLDALGLISQYHGPLFQSHGQADTIVPIRLGQKLFASANPPKQFLALPGADHNDPLGPDYYHRVREFLEAHTSPRPPTNPSTN
ncbi:MAG TPA: alpha/beta hydrolase, partial [Thermoguttaceae bacterium]|nr:alpha/beta hydrolase [Thermoguttaceae bacterium]